MSTITKKWTEELFREAIANLDSKTGLNGRAMPIRLMQRLSVLGYFYPPETGEMHFRFSTSFFNAPSFEESAAIDVIRHEYAHYYNYIMNIKRFIPHKKGAHHHGDDWKWSCTMVGADPTRMYTDNRFKSRRLSVEQAKAMFEAQDVRALDIKHHIEAWGVLPLSEKDEEYYAKRLRENTPANKYYETGDKAMHPEHGFGVVCETYPYYGNQLVRVAFEDAGERTFPGKELFKLTDGKLVV